MLPPFVDSLGRLRITFDAPTPLSTFMGGLAVSENAQVHVNFNAPQGFVNSYGTVSSGALCVSHDSEDGYVGGLPRTTNGALKAQENNIPDPTDPYVGGVRVGPLGGVYTTYAVAPPPPTTVINMQSFPIDSRVSVVRNSIGTGYGVNGEIIEYAINEPRPYRTPQGGAVLGTMSEESSTNKNLSSSDFSTAYWNKIQCTLPLSRLAPDGVSLAYKLVPNVGVQGYLINAPGTISSAGVTETQSVYAWAGEDSDITIIAQANMFSDAAARTATFNLATGVISGLSGSGASAKMVKLADGGYRCSLTYTPDIAVASGCQIRQNTVGDGVSGSWVWGAQNEPKAAMTSYIPTTTAQASRGAENIKIQGAGFTDFFNPNEGTWLVGCGFDSYESNPPNTVGFVILPSDSTMGNSLRVRANIDILCNAFSASVQTLSPTAPLPPKVVNTPYKIAFNYATDYLNQAANGALSTADTAGALPIGLDRLCIGCDTAGASNINGYVGNIQYWNVKLEDNQIQELTF